jgi:hypothetical protein
MPLDSKTHAESIALGERYGSFLLFEIFDEKVRRAKCQKVSKWGTEERVTADAAPSLYTEIVKFSRI